MLQLESKHRRRVFYLISLLGLVLLFLARRYMDDGSVYASVTDNLIASILGAVVLLSLALYLWPPSEGTHELRPSEIRKALLDGVSSTTNRYLFRGRTGRFLTATVLPDLMRRSSERLRSLELRVQMLDPSNAAVCGIYSDFRRQIGESSETARDTQMKVLAQLVALHAARGATLVKIHIYLASTFSLLRADIGDGYAVLTRESKKEPGIKIAANNAFYDVIIEDFNLTERQARRVPDEPCVTLETLSVEVLRQLVQTWELAMELTDDEAAHVVGLARNLQDPYA